MGHCTMPEPATTPQETGCTAEHAVMGHCTMAEEKPSEPVARDPDCPPEHATMGHCTPSAGPVEGATVGTNLPAGDAPAPRPVAASYADRVWGQDAMQPARDMLRREHGGGTYSQVMIDLAEVKIADGHEGYKFEADAWFGGDINRFVFKADGEGEFGEPVEEVELKALYSRAIGPYFNLQAGVRQDLGVGPDRTHAAIGVEGLAPYWFEVDGYVYLSTEGEVRASASAEYDQRITQRLILQPKVEFDLSAQDIPEIGIGSGLTSAELGLRLRYEFAREFAPYVGIVHETKFGRTADFARAAGDDASSTNFVIGVRAWF
jgi:copper resistance protein B